MRTIGRPLRPLRPGASVRNIENHEPKAQVSFMLLMLDGTYRLSSPEPYAL